MQNENILSDFEVTEIKDNKFNVYGDNGSFYWLVHGKRLDLDVEPNKKDIIIKGDGPYLYKGN